MNEAFKRFMVTHKMQHLCQFIYTLLFTTVYCSYNNVTFEYQSSIDGYLCGGQSTVIYFETRRSKLECADACAQVSKCSSFFYVKSLNNCYGSKSLHESTNGCFPVYGTVYYKKGKQVKTGYIMDLSNLSVRLAKHTVEIY